MLLSSPAHTFLCLTSSSPSLSSLASDKKGANAVSALLIIRRQQATGAANNPKEGQRGASWPAPETQPSCPLSSPEFCPDIFTNLEERHKRREDAEHMHDTGHSHVRQLEKSIAKWCLAFARLEKCRHCRRRSLHRASKADHTAASLEITAVVLKRSPAINSKRKMHLLAVRLWSEVSNHSY